MHARYPPLLYAWYVSPYNTQINDTSRYTRSDNLLASHWRLRSRYSWPADGWQNVKRRSLLCSGKSVSEVERLAPRHLYEAKWYQILNRMPQLCVWEQSIRYPIYEVLMYNVFMPQLYLSSIWFHVTYYQVILFIVYLLFRMRLIFEGCL